MNAPIAKDWEQFLEDLFLKKSFLATKKFLAECENSKKDFFPPSSEIFEAFNSCKLSNVKVVILGQDPYHKKGQAHGLAFSVNSNMSIPPSLNNIFKEINADLNLPIPKSGNLMHWANEGVLLLNSVLTVFPNAAGSHAHLGWQEFTDGVIKLLSNTKEKLVFILWGSYAQKKQELINGNKHLVLKSVHPSPLSAYRGFFGKNNFSKANAYLVEHQKKPVDWRIK